MHFPIFLLQWRCGPPQQAATIDTLERIFVAEGLPETLVTDNVAQFTAGEFAKFCKTNGTSSHVRAAVSILSRMEKQRGS